MFENIIDKDNLELFNKECMNVIRELCIKETNYYGFRVYIDGKETDNEFMRSLYKKPPLIDETIKEYAERVFPNTKFGMIINRGEKFSNLLADKFSQILYPLAEKVGYPLTGFNITIFIGNYGWTPLGIHQDSVGENVLHFHLGPGNKIMYTWDKEIYKEKADNKYNNKIIEPLLPFAEKFEFKTGDLYFMPWDKWHVGYSDELSVGATLWFNNPTKSTLLQRILDSIKFQYLQENEEVLPPTKEINDPKIIDEILNLIDIEDEYLQSLNFKQLVEAVYEEYNLAIFSNGGWWSKPLSLEEEYRYNVEEYEHFENSIIKTDFPYTIQYKERNGKLLIFARGSKIEMIYSQGLINIINALNTHCQYQVPELLKKLDEEWPIEAGYYFISLLYDKKALSKVD